jgi:ABC-type glycerol-3-phosphate transport system permease component
MGGGRLTAKILLHFFLVVFAIVVFIPFYWMLISSFKTVAEMYSPDVTIVPKVFYYENYINLFTNTGFIRWFFNSVIISVGTLALGLFICSLTGFVFAVYSFRFKKPLFWIILASITIPEIVIIIPLFVLMVNLKLLNTYLALIIPYSMNIFGIFFVKQFITVSVPFDLIYSARVDGCSEMGIYFRIVLPLCKPGLAVLAVFLWLYSWVQYFWPLIMLKTETLMTMPLGLTAIFTNPYFQEYGVLMAGAFIATLPLIILFIFVQDFFVSGLTRGAIKG